MVLGTHHLKTSRLIYLVVTLLLYINLKLKQGQINLFYAVKIGLMLAVLSVL